VLSEELSGSGNRFLKEKRQGKRLIPQVFIDTKNIIFKERNNFVPPSQTSLSPKDAPLASDWVHFPPFSFYF
jgi:hypothetical protein